MYILRTIFPLAPHIRGLLSFGFWTVKWKISLRRRLRLHWEDYIYIKSGVADRHPNWIDWLTKNHDILWRQICLDGLKGYNKKKVYIYAAKQIPSFLQSTTRIFSILCTKSYPNNCLGLLEVIVSVEHLLPKNGCILEKIGALFLIK